MYSAPKPQIEQALNAFCESFNLGNVDDMLHFYTADAELMPPVYASDGDISRGRVEVLAFWHGAMNMGLTVQKEVLDITELGHECIVTGVFTFHDVYSIGNEVGRG